MKIYVGRWDLLPKEWEGINGLYEKSEEEIIQECAREIDAYAETHDVEDNLMGGYTAEEFEETFNEDEDRLKGATYWIKFF